MSVHGSCFLPGVRAFFLLLFLDLAASVFFFYFIILDGKGLTRLQALFPETGLLNLDPCFQWGWLLFFLCVTLMCHDLGGRVLADGWAKGGVKGEGEGACSSPAGLLVLVIECVCLSRSFLGWDGMA
jgi:hypothetical protein